MAHEIAAMENMTPAMLEGRAYEYPITGDETTLHYRRGGDRCINCGDRIHEHESLIGRGWYHETTGFGDCTTDWTRGRKLATAMESGRYVAQPALF